MDQDRQKRIDAIQKSPFSDATKQRATEIINNKENTLEEADALVGGLISDETESEASSLGIKTETSAEEVGLAKDVLSAEKEVESGLEEITNQK